MQPGMEAQLELPPPGPIELKGKKATELAKHLAAIGADWFEQCQSDRIGQERQWYLNLAFFYGNQNVQFRGMGSNFDLYVPKAPYYKVRMVVNQIRRIIRKEIARLTAQKPNAFVVPASNEDTDVFAAQAGEQIWDSLWRRLFFVKTLRQAVFWQSVIGTGFIKSYWDATKVDKESGTEGDIVIENILPFHIYVPDLLEERIEEQPYIIHSKFKHKEWVKANFGIDTDNEKVKAVDEQLYSIMGINKAEKKKDQVAILEIWVKPGTLPALPSGGMFTIVGEECVQIWDRMPYEHEQYPFTKLDSIPSGKFYSTSIIEDLIPLQRELNRTRSQLIEAKNRMAKPQLLAQEGSVNPKQITTEPGQVIQYKPGFDPPQPLPLQNLPSYVTEEIDRLYTDMSDMSGQHEVSNGSTPPGVTAATAISFLQEQDETLIANHYTSIEESIEKVASQCLFYVKMFWDTERTVKVVGVEGSFDVQTFKGSDLRSNTDIRCEAGSSLPQSRAAKQAFIMDLMKMGFIPPEKGLEIMEIGGLNRIYEEIQVDRRQAARENLKMRVVSPEDIDLHNEEWMAKQQEQITDVDSELVLDPPLIVPVNTWDNHALHIEEHNRYRKSQYYDSMSDMTKALFEEHVRMHQEAMSAGVVHPLTGMDPNSPNAPQMGEEEATEQEMMDNGELAQDGGADSTTGPAPMPEMSDEMPAEG